MRDASRARQRLRRREPTRLKGSMSCPRILRGEAAAEWRRVTTELEALGLLSRSDREIVVAFCQTWADWCEAVREIAIGGSVVMSANHIPMQSPWVGIRNKSAIQLQRLGAELGRSPASRADVQAAPTDDEERERDFNIA